MESIKLIELYGFHSLMAEEKLSYSAALNSSLKSPIKQWSVYLLPLGGIIEGLRTPFQVCFIWTASSLAGSILPAIRHDAKGCWLSIRLSICTSSLCIQSKFSHGIKLEFTRIKAALKWLLLGVPPDQLLVLPRESSCPLHILNLSRYWTHQVSQKCLLPVCGLYKPTTKHLLCGLCEHTLSSFWNALDDGRHT